MYQNIASKEFLCCCRFHVKTGTIILGIIHMFVNTFFLSMMIMVCFQRTSISTSNFAANKTDFNIGYIYGDSWLALASRKVWSREDKFIGVLVAMFSFIASLLLLVGVIKGRATFMVPFFSLQLLDFFLACLTALGYIMYMPDIKKWLSLQNIPFRQEILSLRTSWLLLIFVIFILAVLLIKVYLLELVWKCMKYISMLRPESRDISESLLLERRSEENNQLNIVLPTVNTLVAPPKYEDAVHMAIPTHSTNDQPPPPYSSV